jgi:hypothetical protein
VTLGHLVLFVAQTVPPPTPAPSPGPAASAASSGWSLSSLPTIIISGATAVGLARVLELLITRKSRSTGDQKVQVDAASVISTELRQWAAEANARAKLAEERAEIIQTRLQARVDELMAKLDKAEKKIRRHRGRLRPAARERSWPVRQGRSVRSAPQTPIPGCRSSSADPRTTMRG